MSTRAIASATGMSKSQINREMPTVPNGTVQGVNGKTYAARQPEPEVLDMKKAALAAVPRSDI